MLGGNPDNWVQPTAAQESFTAVVAGLFHSCANQSVLCFGDQTYNQATVPANLGPVVAISAGGGGFHTCAIQANGGAAVCWGDNASNQSTVPADIGPVTAIAAGKSHTCALGGSGVRCW